MIEKELRKAAIDKGMNLHNLAAIAGITYQTLHRRFENSSMFTVREIMAIREGLGLNSTDVERIFFQ